MPPIKLAEPELVSTRGVAPAAMFADLDAVPQQWYVPARELTDPRALTAARRLHAQVYLDCGYFTAADVTAEGVACDHADPFTAQSTYFATCQDPSDPASVGATARLIHPRTLSDVSIPRLTGIDPSALATLARMPLHRIAEISALVRSPGASAAHVIGVYAAIYRYASAHGIAALVATVDQVVNRLISRVVGSARQVVGPTQTFMGSPCVPTILWLGEAHAEALLLADTDPSPMAQAKPLLFPSTSVRGRGAW